MRDRDVRGRGDSYDHDAFCGDRDAERFTRRVGLCGKHGSVLGSWRYKKRKDHSPVFF